MLGAAGSSYLCLASFLPAVVPCRDDERVYSGTETLLFLSFFFFEGSSQRFVGILMYLLAKSSRRGEKKETLTQSYYQTQSIEERERDANC